MISATENNAKSIGAISNEELPKIWDAIKALQARPAGEGKVVQQITNEKVDLSGLDDKYASKLSPDLTMVRIEELEK